MDATDDIAFLAASEHRGAILESLYRDQPLGRGELADRCGAARVTVSRNLEKLRDRGFADEGPDGFELTALGAPLAEDLVDMAETAAAADRLAPVLRHVPREAFDLDVRALADADVAVSTRADPYAPVSRHERTLQVADRARLLLPAVGREPLSTAAERAAVGELEMVMVLSRDVASTLRTDEYREDAESMLDAGVTTALEYDGDVPYYLGVVDGSVQLGVDDEDGIPRALAESDDERVRDWASETFRSYRSAARPFELDG